jgi:Fe-S cluster assembly iron-binding protein IscA
MLTLSEAAATLLGEARARQGIPDDALLRVAAASGQEQGLRLGFVDQPQAGDQTGTAHGMKMCVAADVADDLEGTAIDVETIGDDTQLVIVPAS